MNLTLTTQFSIISYPLDMEQKVVVFCVIGNERHLLPYFLNHYRALGVQLFCFVVDKESSDGTTEYLITEKDCLVITSNLNFGDPVKLTFGSFKSGKNTIELVIFLNLSFPMNF